MGSINNKLVDKSCICERRKEYIELSDEIYSALVDNDTNKELVSWQSD